jgi:pimeloyl-ACP methyl ester carboxylesterase
VASLPCDLVVPPTRDSVILVHGLWLSGWALAPLRLRLEHAGFRAPGFSYHSVRDDLDTNARELARFVDAHRGRRTHVVGHSLGGLVALRMLGSLGAAVDGRVVLLGSPFAGSAAAESVGRLPFGRSLLGHSLPEWLAAPRPGPDPMHQIGVIAGSLGAGAGRLVAELDSPNDGTVAVAETQVPGMTDHVVLPVTHTGLLTSARVAHQVIAFLRDGRFERESPA